MIGWIQMVEIDGLILVPKDVELNNDRVELILVPNVELNNVELNNDQGGVD